MGLDFVIVGGGVYGAGVAWELAKRGAEVLVLEAGEIASGASGGPGKRGVRANGRDVRELPLMRAATELWPDLHEQLGAPTGYERVGSLNLLERDRDMAGAAAQAWAQEQQGIPTTLLNAEAVREMEPALSTSIQGGLSCPNDGVADHTATTRALAQAAQRHGAVIRERTRVTQLERSGDRIVAVITEQEERIEVGHTALLLANTGVPDLLQAQFGVTLPVWTVWPQFVVTEPMEPMPVHHLIGHASRLLSMKSTTDSRVMISGGWRGRWNPNTGQGEPQPDQVEGNVAEAVAVFPSLEGVAVSSAKTDRRESTTIDGIPIIDRVPGLSNAVFATGWSGHGWAIAPAVNQLLAAWVYSDSNSSLLHPFRYSRFTAS